MHKIPPSPKGHSYAFGDIAQSQLANGIRVVTYQRPGTNAAAFEVLYGCGGRHEPDSVVGVSHGLEHMMFKGTPRRTAQQIRGAMEGIGGRTMSSRQKSGQPTALSHPRMFLRT